MQMTRTVQKPAEANWTAAVELAVVIPAYRQPGLLPEAILSVLGR
jgi:hypothetical protein